MSDASDVLVVEVGSTRCALRLADVVEVVPAVEVVALPDVPAPIEGVIDLRGRLVPVVNGRLLLGLAPSPVRLGDRLVVLSTDHGPRALRVDAATSIATAPADELAVSGEVDRTAALARMPDGLLVILDPAEFLTAEAARSIEDAMADVPARAR